MILPGTRPEWSLTSDGQRRAGDTRYARSSIKQDGGYNELNERDRSGLAFSWLALGNGELPNCSRRAGLVIADQGAKMTANFALEAMEG